MAATNIKGFLDELATFIAAGASITFASTPRALFIGELVEKDSTLTANSPTPASVLSVYDGNSPRVPVTTVICQIKTIGLPSANAAALQRAQALHGMLQDANRAPLRMKVLPTSGSPLWRINAILNLRGPSLSGRDPIGRPQYVSNFDAEIVPLT